MSNKKQNKKVNTKRAKQYTRDFEAKHGKQSEAQFIEWLNK
jgi:hypothetical protein